MVNPKYPDVFDACHNPWQWYTFVTLAAALNEMIVDGVDEELE
jgi:hypothetical protein